MLASYHSYVSKLVSRIVFLRIGMLAACDDTPQPKELRPDCPRFRCDKQFGIMFGSKGQTLRISAVGFEE